MITPAFNLTATERVLPRLALDFTTASLDSRITFTRALNTATRFNSSGFIEVVNANIPRFDFNPVTLVCRGLLIEESRDNLLIQSENFPTWSNATTTATLASGTSPANTNTANKLAPTNGANATLSYITKSYTKAASAITYTYSAFVKEVEYNQALLMMHGTSTANRAQAIINLTTGALSGTGAVGTFTNYSGSSENVGNGWFRIRITATSNTDTVLTVRLYPYKVGGTGDGTSGILAWGTQLEAGAFVTSYIPTTTTALTRNADVAVMTGTNFSNWFNATEGGAVIQVIPRAITGTKPAIQFDDNTANEIIALRGSAADPQLYIVDGGAAQATLDAGTITANSAYKLGGAWKNSSFATAINGGAAVSQSSGTYPTVTQARLGSDGTDYLNGWLQNLQYWPQRITDAEVQAFSK